MDMTYLVMYDISCEQCVEDDMLQTRNAEVNFWKDIES